MFIFLKQAIVVPLPPVVNYVFPNYNTGVIVIVDWSHITITLKTESCHGDNFFVISGTAVCVTISDNKADIITTLGIQCIVLVSNKESRLRLLRKEQVHNSDYSWHTHQWL